MSHEQLHGLVTQAEWMALTGNPGTLGKVGADAMHDEVPTGNPRGKESSHGQSRNPGGKVGAGAGMTDSKTTLSSKEAQERRELMLEALAHIE